MNSIGTTRRVTLADIAVSPLVPKCIRGNKTAVARAIELSRQKEINVISALLDVAEQCGGEASSESG